MIRIYIITGLFLVLNSAIGQTKNFIDQPFLETTAYADTMISPDRIYLSIFISESDTKGKQSVEELEREMADKLKEIGIDLDKQLTLTDLSSNFKKYFLRKKDILKAKSFELLVYDAKTAGLVIYELEGIRISNVGLERTEYFRIENLKLELKSIAIIKAKKQAEAMATPLQQSVGRAIFISDINSVRVNALAGIVDGVRLSGLSSMKKEYTSIPIEFEKIKVECEVNVKFAIN